MRPAAARPSAHQLALPKRSRRAYASARSAGTPLRTARLSCSCIPSLHLALPARSREPGPRAGRAPTRAALAAAARGRLWPCNRAGRKRWRSGRVRVRGCGARRSRSSSPSSSGTSSPSSPPPSPTTPCSRCSRRSSSWSRSSASSASPPTPSTRCWTRSESSALPGRRRRSPTSSTPCSRRNDSGLVLIVSLILALWAASAYVGSFMAASDRIYEVTLRRRSGRACRCASAWRCCCSCCCR